ncbi:unnamed protein product [Bathycoccus prasinos]|jgi:hypothetical protein
MTSSFPIVCSALVVANRNKNKAFFASFSSSSSRERRKTSSSKVFPIGASKSSGNSNATTTTRLKTPSKTTIQTKRKGTTRRRASSENDVFQEEELEEEKEEEEESTLFYPARLDVVPAFVGGLNPVNSFLSYFSGAVLTQGTVKTTTQWTLFVVLPILFVMYLVRKWRYEGDVERRILLSASSGDDGRNSGSSGSGSSNDDKTSSGGGANNARTTPTMKMMSYSRSMRGRWLDVHVCYAFLLPAGISAGEHSSYWLVLAPAFMLYRFLCREERVTKSSGEDFNATTTTTKRPLLFSSSSSSPFFAFLSPVGRGWSALALILRRAHKYAKIVLASLALALLVASGSATLHQSLTALSGGGMALRVLLSPFAIGVAFLGYFAPAALLPRYISRVFSRKVISADEEEATRKARLTKEERVELETKRETEKKNRKWWLLIGFIAMGISAFTGSDLPIVLAFAAQLLKANPDALLTAMAEKGGMVEFETKIADAFDRVVLSKKERERERDENENESENETGAK